MVDFKLSKKAVTVVEVMVAITITSVIMGVAMAMMSRNNIQFKKSNELINIQRLMDNIVERIRSDVRSLKRVNSYSKNSIEFVIVKELDEVTISYEFNPEENTLYRSEKSDKDIKSDFHGSKQIVSMIFIPKFYDDKNDDEDNDELQEKYDEEALKGKKFKCLNVALQIAGNSNDLLSNKKGNTSTLSIACQYYSTCVESELRISKLKKK